MVNAADWMRNLRGAKARGVVGTALGTLLLACVAVLAGRAVQAGDAAGDDAVITVAAPRMVVLKSKRVLHLFDGDRLVQSYPVDLGVNPVGPKRREGDGRTALGSFRVVTKNAESSYHRFIGLDYPNAGAVARGLADGLISPGEAVSLRAALAANRCPDWGTALGGGLGIHGHRQGTDWTGGCIALSDAHVAELFSLVRIGDPVEILP